MQTRVPSRGIVQRELLPGFFHLCFSLQPSPLHPHSPDPPPRPSMRRPVSCFGRREQHLDTVPHPVFVAQTTETCAEGSEGSRKGSNMWSWFGFNVNTRHCSKACFWGSLSHGSSPARSFRKKPFESSSNVEAATPGSWGCRGSQRPRLFSVGALPLTFRHSNRA